MELLKQIAPTVTRVAVLRDPGLTSGVGQFAVIEYVAPSVGIEVSAINMHDAREIEQDIAKFASSPNGGLILTGSALSVVHRDLVIALAAQHKLPAVYYRRYFVTSGGLISYGWVADDQFRGAAHYASIASSRARSLPICRFRHRRSMSWSSILRPPRRSAFQCHNHSCLAPTRLSNSFCCGA